MRARVARAALQTDSRGHFHVSSVFAALAAAAAAVAAVASFSLPAGQRMVSISAYFPPLQSLSHAEKIEWTKYRLGEWRELAGA